VAGRSSFLVAGYLSVPALAGGGSRVVRLHCVLRLSASNTAPVRRRSPANASPQREFFFSMVTSLRWVVAPAEQVLRGG